ncbi:MAG: ThiF family adenylyltransferase [Synergistetes bacterium]|nr:ThiF family adenylyltransferase [Synergistota bacterium]
MDILLKHENLVKRDVLKRVSILVAGTGDLGSMVSELSAKLGIGKIYIVDRVDAGDLGKKRAEALIRRLSQISGETLIQWIPKNVEDHDFSLPEDILVIMDCLDNWKGHVKLESLTLGKDLFIVFGRVKEMYGQITTLLPPETPPLREIFEDFKEEGELKVYLPLAMALASLQVWEMVNSLLGRPRLLGKILTLDLWQPSLEIAQINRS